MAAPQPSGVLTAANGRRPQLVATRGPTGGTGLLMRTQPSPRVGSVARRAVHRTAGGRSTGGSQTRQCSTTLRRSVAPSGGSRVSASAREQVPERVEGPIALLTGRRRRHGEPEVAVDEPGALQPADRHACGLEGVGVRPSLVA